MDAATVLRRARTQSGLSRRALARRAGTSAPTLLAYETGAKVPRVDTVDRIVRAAGFSLEAALQRRADSTDDDRVAKGRELVEALELAAMFPARHSAKLRFPPLPAPR